MANKIVTTKDITTVQSFAQNGGKTLQVQNEQLGQSTYVEPIPFSEKGAPNGVATLDADGKLVQGIDGNDYVPKTDIGVTVAPLQNGKVPNENLKFGKAEENNTDVVSGGEVFETKVTLSKGNLVLNSTKKNEINSVLSELFIDGLQSNEDVSIFSFQINVTNNSFRIFLQQGSTLISTNNFIPFTLSDINKPIKLSFVDGRTSGYVVFSKFNQIEALSINAKLDNNKLKDLNFNPIILNFLIPKKENNIQFNFTSNTDVNLRIKELYLTGDYSSYRLRRLYVQSNSIRLFIGVGNVISDVVQLGYDNIDSEMYGKVITLYHATKLEIVGYIVLYRFNNINYTVDTTATFREEAGVLENSPLINEYLSRSENLLLIGTSMFGFNSQQNVLKPFLAHREKYSVFNCGFGGTRMSWRTSNGSNAYDKFTAPDVADALVSNNFDPLITANTSLANIFKVGLTDLMNVDLNKPTTIFCNYIDNDIALSAVIGQTWKFNESIDSYDKSTYLGAMNYLVRKLTVAYPHIKWVFFSESWRIKLDKNGVLVPPYAYENSIGNKGYIYSEKLKENCEISGLSFYDFVKNGIQNPYNNSEFFVDPTHFNYKGWKYFSVKLKDTYNSYLR